MLSTCYFSEKRAKMQVVINGTVKIVNLPYAPSAGKRKTAGARPRRLFRIIDTSY